MGIHIHPSNPWKKTRKMKNVAGELQAMEMIFQEKCGLSDHAVCCLDDRLLARDEFDDVLLA